MSSTSETPQETPQVRDMRAEEVETLWRWTAEGLWNQSLRDVRVYYKCHPEGWRAVDVDGELAGCVAGFNVNDAYKSIGMVFVSPKYRKRGLAKILLTDMENYLQIRNGNINAAISSVKTLPDFYCKYAGYSIRSWTSQVYEGRPNVDSLPATLDGVTLSDDYKPTSQLEAILEYDATIHTPCERGKYWELMCSTDENKCVVARQGKTIVGIGCIKPAVTGYRVAPLYSENADVARCLFRKLCTIVEPMLPSVSGADGDQVDTPQVLLEAAGVNTDADFLVSECGLKSSAGLVRLYSKEMMNLPWGKVYSFADNDIHVV